MKKTPRPAESRTDLPILIGFTVITLLVMIIPPARDWLGAQLWPLGVHLASGFVVMWEFLTGVSAALLHTIGGLF